MKKTTIAANLFFKKVLLIVSLFSVVAKVQQGGAGESIDQYRSIFAFRNWLRLVFILREIGAQSNCILKKSVKIISMLAAEL